MDRMSILIVGNYIEDNGGISGIIYNHFIKVREEGHDVAIFNTKRSSFERLFLFLPLLIKSRNYNIIHVHGCSSFGFYPVVLGIIVGRCFYRKRTVVTYHGGGAEEFLQKHSKFVRTILLKANCVMVMSGFLQNVFKKYRIDTTILPNLIDVEIREDSFLCFDLPRLISIRALKRNYNIDDIINALSIINEKYPNSQLKIIGTGEKYELLLSLSEQLKVANVTFEGMLINEQIPDELLKSNIMISVPSFDNQPMSILEAFACGVPVISSRVGGIPFMIEDWETGFLVDVHKPEQIAEKVNWIMTNPEKTKKVIENAKSEVKRYQWSSIKKQLFDIYEGEIQKA